MSKRILVTGGAGFIGSAVVRHIIRETPHQALVVDKLTYAGNLDSLAPVSNDPRYAFVRADICDAPKMRELFESFRPDAVMHLAAESHVDRSIDGPGEFIQTNVVGTFALLQAALGYWRALPAAQQEGFRFHHISTDEVFGSLGEEGMFVETTAYDPRSPYSASKASSDHLVRAWHHTYGLPVVVTNCSNNYGPYHFPEKLIPLTIINALEGLKLPVYGKGANVRDWLYVDDHARALLAVVLEGAVGETYCIGGRNEKTNLDVVETICALMDELAPSEQDRPAQVADQFRHRSSGPRHALRDRCRQDRDRPRLGAARDVRDRPAQDGGMVSRQPQLVGAHPQRRLSRRAAGGRCLILVFGGNGQLGQELTRAAAMRTAPLTALSRSESDITDSAAVRGAIAQHRPSLVVNAASYTKVDLAEKEAEAARQANEVGPAVLGTACASAGIPLVHISTDYVFDGAKPSAYVEDDPIAPINGYGASKAGGERAVRETAPRHVILRSSWIYGEFGNNFLKTMLRLAAERDELRVVADQRGCPTSTPDLANAILTIAPRLAGGDAVWGTYHYAGDGVTTWHAFASRIVATQAPLTGKSPRVTAITTAEFPTPARRPANSELDCSRFASVFGFGGRKWTAETDNIVRALLAAKPEKRSNVA